MILEERFITWSNDGDYFGGISRNYEVVEISLRQAKILFPDKQWQIISWYD